MNLSSILLAVAIVAGLGLLLGLGLAAASVIMAVPVDKKAELIREALPGANCGACGYSGCDAYAAAISKGITKNTALCVPGGTDVSMKISEITGLAAGTIEPKAAVVLCRGNKDNCGVKMNYVGIESCKMAKQLFGGPKSCIYGCIGYGDCAAVCEYSAISIVNGIAQVDPLKCRACKKCINTCPNSLIKLLPVYEAKAAVKCANKDKGAMTRKVCSTGCIGCMKCMKTCENEAIKVENFCARIDSLKCTGCGKCAEVCPVGAITCEALAAQNC